MKKKLKEINKYNVTQQFIEDQIKILNTFSVFYLLLLLLILILIVYIILFYITY